VRFSYSLIELFDLVYLTHLKVSKLMATQAELATELRAVNVSLEKIGGETATLLQKIADLEAAVVAGGTTTPEVDAALAAVKAQATRVDDMVPDAPQP